MSSSFTHLFTEHASIASSTKSRIMEVPAGERDKSGMTLFLQQRGIPGKVLKLRDKEIKDVLGNVQNDNDESIVYEELIHGRNFNSMQIVFGSHNDAIKVRDTLNGHQFFSEMHKQNVVLTVDFFRK